MSDDITAVNNSIQQEHEGAHLSEERFLEFSLGEENYAIPLLRVKEVIAVPKTTPIPNTPAHFNGIMNLRGQVISVMDLRKKLNIKPQEQSEETAVIILDLSPVFLGCVVDSVNKVLSIAKSQISEPPEIEGHLKIKYIDGVYRAESKMIVLLDIAKALDIADLEILKKSA